MRGTVVLLWNSCKGNCQRWCHEDLPDKEWAAGLTALPSAITTRGHCLIVTGEINHYTFKTAKLQRSSFCWLNLISDAIYLFCAPTIYSGAICSGSTLSAESMPRERQLCCSSPGECLVLLLGVWEGRATQQTVSCWAHSSVSSQILLIVVTHAWFPKPLFWGLPPRPAWEGGLLLRPCLKGSSMASSPGSGWEGMWRPCTCGIPREDQAVDGRGGMMASRFISPWCWCLAEAQHHHVCDAWPCVCPACGGTGGTASLPLGRKKVWFFFFFPSVFTSDNSNSFQARLSGKQRVFFCIWSQMGIQRHFRENWQDLLLLSLTPVIINWSHGSSRTAPRL